MSSLKLKHSGGNSVSLNPPTSAPTSSEVAFKLPNADGSANQVLKTDGSGNLSFGAGGLFSSYAIISDTKASNVNGGTFTAGAWQTRDLQTENADPDNIVSISSNQFTLQAGSYLIKFQSTGYHVHRHITKLRDITNSANKGYGIMGYSNTTNATSNISHGMARVTISGATVYEIQHACQTTKSTNGMGLNTYIDTSGSYTDNTEPNSVYTIVEIYKEN